MATVDEIEKKKIKIELDLKEAKSQLESLGKGIKQREDQLKNFSKLLNSNLNLNAFQRKNTIGAAGYSVGSWNQMSDVQKTKARAAVEKDLAAQLDKRYKAEKKIYDLSQKQARLNEQSLNAQLREQKKLNKELQKQVHIQSQNAENAANIVSDYQKAARKPTGAAARAEQVAEVAPKTLRAGARRFVNQAMWRAGNFAISTAISSAKFAIQSSAQMEDWLSETQAIAGSTSGTMGQLAKSIYEVGSNSRFTTEELTKTTTVLAQAGYSAEDISKLLGSVNSLATATGTDLRTSVDLLTSSMSLWTSQTEDASRMVDSLVVAVNSSKAEISSIQKGMQYAGAAASQMGMSFNETVAAMSAVTNAGLKTRSIMGTGLRAVLTELADPSKKLQKELDKVGLTINDVNVRSQGFTNVMTKLAEAGFGAENAFRGMDRQAASFYLALKSQLDLNNQLLETMERRGVAEKAEQVRMDTTIAQLGRLKNVWFEIFGTLGKPVNLGFKKVLESANEASELLASGLRKIGGEAKDADTVIERTSAEMDSLKTSAKALSEEMWNIAKAKIGENAEKANKAHANLTDRFNNERRVVRGLSQDYKQLKEYMLDIAVGQENENVESARRRVGANLANVTRFSDDFFDSLFKGYKGNRAGAMAALSQLSSEVGLKAPTEKLSAPYATRDFVRKQLSPKLQSMPIEQLQALIYNFQSGSPIRGSLERLLTSRQSIGKDMSYILGSPTGDALRKELAPLQEIASSSSAFMTGTQYAKLSKRLNDWKGPQSQQDIETLLKVIDNFRSDMKSVDELANKYPQSLEIQAQTSTAREKLFENIQTLESQITNVATKAMEDIEKDLKNENQANKQGVISNFMKKLQGMLGVSQSGKSWLDATIDKLETAKADVGLIEALKQMREKVLSGLLKSAEIAYKQTIEDANLKYGVSQAGQNYVTAKKTYNQGEITIANLDYIRAQKQAVEEARRNVVNARRTTYQNYSDQQFKDLTNPLDEQVVKLELDENAAIEEANRLGVNGTGFWDSTGNSMMQGAADFFNNINQQSAAYALTLDGLNSVSSGLKTAFKSIAIEGTKVSAAFKQMAISILESLANKAIDKGVDYLVQGLGYAISLGGGAAMSGSGSGSGTGSGNRTYVSSSTTRGGTATMPSGSRVLSDSMSWSQLGGYVTPAGVRHFAAGGGVPGRDSVPAMLMPGEYVMKKSAVDILGKETLDTLNKATSRVSDEKASNVRESKKSKPVVTNVYVVSDAKEAGMTANDVLVTISRDILQGGQTRQLIQQVVQGQY